MNNLGGLQAHFPLQPNFKDKRRNAPTPPLVSPTRVPMATVYPSVPPERRFDGDISPQVQELLTLLQVKMLKHRGLFSTEQYDRAFVIELEIEFLRDQIRWHYLSDKFYRS